MTDIKRKYKANEQGYEQKFINKKIDILTTTESKKKREGKQQQENRSKKQKTENNVNMLQNKTTNAKKTDTDIEKTKRKTGNKYNIIEGNKTVQQNYKIWRIGMWNIRSINGKEEELISEFEKETLDILGIAETKKKEKE